MTILTLENSLMQLLIKTLLVRWVLQRDLELPHSEEQKTTSSKFETYPLIYPGSWTFYGHELMLDGWMNVWLQEWIKFFTLQMDKLSSRPSWLNQMFTRSEVCAKVGMNLDWIYPPTQTRFWLSGKFIIFYLLNNIWQIQCSVPFNAPVTFISVLEDICISLIWYVPGGVKL